MAKKKAASEGVNKSAAIRAFQEAHPGAKAKEVVAGLAAQGIVVTEGLVYQVKPAGAAKGKPGRKPKETSPSTVANGSGKPSLVETIDALKTLQEVTGGDAELAAKLVSATTILARAVDSPNEIAALVGRMSDGKKKKAGHETHG